MPNFASKSSGFLPLRCIIHFCSVGPRPPFKLGSYDKLAEVSLEEKLLDICKVEGVSCLRLAP